MHADLIFRPAMFDDADRIAALHAESWRRHYRGAYSDEFLDSDVFADRQMVWRQRLRTPTDDSATVVACEGADLVGFVHVVFDEDPHWGSLVENLHVTGSRQHRGIGSRLLAEAAARVISHGVSALYLWVLEQNTSARAFYRARGGQCTGQRPEPSPAGIPGRLVGSPVTLRFAWSDATLLLASR
jgi:ribosomal protein S18 acetylase RimI-like enzyme